MVLSLSTMPTNHGDFSISTYSLQSIQQLIFKLMQQVDELAAANNRKKHELRSIQQVLDTFIDPENSQETKNAETQPQQQQEEESVPENSDQEGKNPEKDSNTDPIDIEHQQKIQHSTNSQQQQEDSEIQDPNSTTTNNLIPDSNTTTRSTRSTTTQIQNLRNGRLDAGNEKTGAEDGAFVTGGVSASSSTGVDVNSSGAEVGASAKEKKEEPAASSLTAADLDGTSAKGTGATHSAPQATIGGGDTRARRICSVFPTMDKPPPLLAAAFPWDRGREIQEGGAPAARTNHNRAAQSGVPFRHGSGYDAGSLGSVDGVVTVMKLCPAVAADSLPQVDGGSGARRKMEV